MVQGSKASSTMDITELLDLNGHINMNLMFKPEGPTPKRDSALEPVLLQYMNDFEENLTILYSK